VAVDVTDRPARIARVAESVAVDILLQRIGVVGAVVAEVAHLVAYERCGRRRIEPHGDEWRAACADLGIPGERPYHTLPFKRRRMKRNHAYFCPHCFATIRRVKPIQRSVACYECCRKFNGGRYHEHFRLVKKPAATSI
ncbi:MAG: hypothetical protein ACO3JG_16145, partial [Luteolibacter sp.]